MGNIKRRLLIAGVTVAAVAGIGMTTVSPAASASVAGHKPHPTQILVQHQEKRISCPMYYACFWQNNDLSGNLFEVQSPISVWRNIPVGNRGSVKNTTTTKVVWIYSKQAGTHKCAADSGGTAVNNDTYGWYYIDPGDTCSSFPGAPS